MSDEPTFDFLPWEELSVGVRRNRKRMYNYIVSVLNGEPPVPPTPTGTGTVTVTCQDEYNTPLNGAVVILSTDLQDPTTWIGMGVTDNTGTVTLETIDTTGEHPSPSGTVADIDFGTYSLYAEFSEMEDTFTYNGTLTVDGDENVTITLTEQGNTGTVTVTCQDESENPLENANVLLSTVEQPSSLDEIVGVGITDNTGTCTLMTLDPDTQQPSQTVAQVPFGNYYLNATDGEHDYIDTFVVDGDETVTITLTSE